MEKQHRWLGCLVGLLLVPTVIEAAPVGTAFSYQGYLEKPAGTPLTDTCTFELALCDDAVAVCSPGTTSNHPGIAVTGGVFTLPDVNFGDGAFDGTARWVKIFVQCTGDAGFTTLAPRLELTPAPHALALPGLWTQQDAVSPNLIGGHADNAVLDGAAGAAIGGGGEAGFGNIVYDNFGTVGGGRFNIVGTADADPASAQYATVSGGTGNTASGDRSSILGGTSNIANAVEASISGGRDNQATGQQAAVSGGNANIASGTRAAVTGGASNVASGNRAVVVGGGGNTASGQFSLVPGGNLNLAGGDYSLASGRRAKANHHGAFVWGDSQDADFASTGVDQFLIRADGGVGINTNAPTAALHIGGTAGVDGIRFPDGTLQTTAGGGGGGGGNTLDQAYDQGGPGAGRIITADSGPVRIEGNDGLEVLGTITSGSSIIIDGTAGAETISSTADLAIATAGGVALRLESSPVAPSVVGGHEANDATGMHGATIGGGGPGPSVQYLCSNDFNNCARCVGGPFDGLVCLGETSCSASGECVPDDSNCPPGGTCNLTEYWACTNGTTSCGTCIGGANHGLGCSVLLQCPGGVCEPDDSRCTDPAICAAGGINSLGNRVTEQFGTVSGGQGNTAGGAHATVGGGIFNSASGTLATIGGGEGNTANAASAGRSTVGGGAGNTASGNYATVGGGYNNDATDWESTVGGGASNTASGSRSTVGGGRNNTARAGASTVAGGADNDAGSRCNDGLPCVSDSDCVSGGFCGFASYSTIGGGSNNKASGWMSTVAGGDGNTAGEALATVSGGVSNTASGSYATVGGGQSNEATGSTSTVGGGRENTASGISSTVGGGINNDATANYSTVGGGGVNTAIGDYSTVGGGFSNSANGFGPYGTVGGGENNSAHGTHATVSGGFGNIANRSHSVVGGGDTNTASGINSTVGGGSSNLASNLNATVAGGSSNTASFGFSTVGGGASNTASGPSSTVGGGASNTASGSTSTVPGGFLCLAGGARSFAAGYRAKVRDAATVGDSDGDQGTFVWADSTNADFVSTGPNQFLIRAAGGVGIGTSSPSAIGGLDIESAGSTTDIHINNTAADGDPTIRFQLSGTSVFSMGVDDSDGDKFKIGTGAPQTSTRMTIDSSGNVGIGTTAPANKLDVEGGTAIGASYSGSSAAPANGLIVQGNVGIGTADPSAKLHVNGGSSKGLRIDNSGSGLTGPAMHVVNTNASGVAAWIVNNSTDATVVLSNDGTGALMRAFTPGGTSVAMELESVSNVGRLGINRDNPGHPIHVGTSTSNGNGAHVNNGGMWINGSDRHSKRNFEPLDKQAILEKVIELPVTRWQYKGEAETVRHIGPVAQDFYAAFGTGDDNRYIGTIDADGVALAAIQGLHQIVKDKDCEIGELGSEISNLKSEISELRAMVKALAAQNGGAR